MTRSTALLLIILTLNLKTSAAAEGDFSVKAENKKRAAPSLNHEQQERYADRAALSAQNKAIAELSKLVKKYRGTDREPTLLMKLAEIYQQAAAIQFRVAHGIAHSKQGPVDLSTTHGSTKACIATLDTLISKFHSFNELGRAIFMRGKSYEELENRAKARTDYLVVVNQYSDMPEAILAYMSLANFATDEEKFEVAIQYLKKIEAIHDTPYYPFALYKLAWSYYNLQDLTTAMSYLVRHVHYYDEFAKASEAPLSPSDSAIRENSLMDVTVFFMEGFERKLSQFSPTEALGFFKNLESGTLLGKMLSRYATLLRSHDHEDHLIYWKNLLINKETHLPETADVVMTAFEYLLNNRKYEKVVSTAEDLVTLYEANKSNDNFQTQILKAQTLLLNTAKDLQALTLKNKNATRVSELSSPLVKIYSAFIKLVAEKDPRVYGVHYNLAETLYEIRQFNEATDHYRWVVDHWAKQAPVSEKDAALKAISSRYEDLKTKKLIPENIAARSLSENSNKDQNTIIKQWVKWIDHFSSKFKKEISLVESFSFEANRTLYSQGFLVESTERMEEFAFDFSSSKLAIPSASLVLDTFIQSKEWNRTHTLARKLLKVKVWEKDPFYSKTFGIAADSHFKLTEAAYQAGELDKTLDRVDEFLKLYSKTPRREDNLFIAGQAASQQKDSLKAEKYYSQLISEFPNSENTGAALLARARQEEERFDFAKAGLDYQHYLDLAKISTSKKFAPVPGLKDKILRLHWISNDFDALARLLEKKETCAGDSAETCERFRALIAFEKNQTPEKSNEKPFERALKGGRDIRPIWAAAALQNQEGYSFPDRMLLVRIIAGKWNDLDSLVQMTLIPKLSLSIPRAFALNREAINKFAKIKGDAKSIEHRVKLVQEMENTAAQIVKLPWARTRALALNEIAQLYLDFSQALYDVPAPKDLPESELVTYQETIRKLALPFEEKGQDIRAKAFQVASNFAVDLTSFKAVSEKYFNDNPSLAKALRGEISIPTPTPIAMNTLEDWAPNEDWPSPKSSGISPEKYYKDAAVYYKLLWSDACAKSNWKLATTVLSEGREKKLFEKPLLQILQAATLAFAGSQAEALLTLEENATPRTLVLLINHYLQNYSKDRVRSLLGRLESESDSRKHTMVRATDTADEAFALAYGSQWSGVTISEDNLNSLLSRAAGSSQKDRSAWAKQTLKTLEAARAPAQITPEKKP